MEVLVERAVIVGVHEQKDQHFEYAMEELKNLAEAIDVEVVGEVTQNHGKTQPIYLCWERKNGRNQATFMKN